MNLSDTYNVTATNNISQNAVNPAIAPKTQIFFKNRRLKYQLMECKNSSAGSYNYFQDVIMSYTNESRNFYLPDIPDDGKVRV